MTKYFKRFGLTMNVRKNNDVEIIDTVTGKTYGLSANLEQCVNEAFDGYSLRSRDSFIYKVNTYNKLQITADNA